ncbi:MAG: hypothetical protein AAF501_05170 [Pseudomonadota bacterium]
MTSPSEVPGNGSSVRISDRRNGPDTDDPATIVVKAKRSLDQTRHIDGVLAGSHDDIRAARTGHIGIDFDLTVHLST